MVGFYFEAKDIQVHGKLNKNTINNKKPNTLIYEKVKKDIYNEQCKLNSVDKGI